jgi:hypothetical protein
MRVCVCVCVTLCHGRADDSVFYDTPRFVYHIDEGAVKALTE